MKKKKNNIVLLNEEGYLVVERGRISEGEEDLWGRPWDLVQGSRDLMQGIHHAQVVDGSTPQQVGREGLIPTSWKVSWYMEGNCQSEIGMSVQKLSKQKVPRIGFAWCGKCSHTPWHYFAPIPCLPAAIWPKNQICLQDFGVPPV